MTGDCVNVGTVIYRCDTWGQWWMFVEISSHTTGTRYGRWVRVR